MDSGTEVDAAIEVVVVLVHGLVQGVGFRWWTRSRALELGLTGSATNLADGDVEVEAHGERAACEELVRLLTEQPAGDPPPGAHRTWRRRPGVVEGASVTWRHAAVPAPRGFVEA